MNIIESTLSEENINDLKKFLSKFWREDHPIVKSEDLLRWQYTGFGKRKGFDLFQMFYDEKELIGIRGIIPQEMQLPMEDGSYLIEPMGACAMWMIEPEYRKKGALGLGYKIHRKVESSIDILMSIGANINTSAPIYRKRRYFEKEALNRYIIPLSSGYNDILINSVDEISICKWIENTSLADLEYEEIQENTNYKELENIWVDSTKSQNILSIYRSSEFWEWRYGKSPIFKYHIFGNKDLGGIVVARIEDAIKDINSNESIKVLRIVEVIPCQSDVWNGGEDVVFENLISNVLLWGKKNNCVAADFHCSTSRLAKTLQNVGFKEQFIDNKENILSLSGLFQPIIDSTYAFNCFIRVGEKFSYSRENFNYENSYIVRTDSDQDRPNIIF